MALFFILLTAGVPLVASTATDFYLELLQRGTMEVDAGRYDTSITPLRLAAFGLVDSIEHYETAQAYLVVALDKLGKQDEARRAAQRIVAAEAIERKFAALALPAPIRTAFAVVARKLLSSVDAALLTAPPTQSSVVPKPSGTSIVPAAQSPSIPQAAPKEPAKLPATQTQTPATQKPSLPTQRVDPPKVVENPKPAPQTPPRKDPPTVRAPQTSQNGSSSQKPAVAETPKRNDPPKVSQLPKPSPPTTTAAATPPKTTPAAPKPQPEQSVLQPQIRTTSPQPARVDVPTRLAAGERALASANLTEARRVYRELLTVPTLDRDALIRIGEGLYRSRDFAAALTAFRRLGTLKPGEEAYRYYIAVALFETGDFAAAKRELATALPFIEITPDVQRYRDKIGAARN
jgi:Flp pilus assembly protein TadD